MSRPTSRNRLRPDTLDVDGGVSDGSSSRVTSKIIDAYTYGSSASPTSPGFLHAPAPKAEPTNGTAGTGNDRVVPGFFHISTPRTATPPSPRAASPQRSTSADPRRNDRALTPSMPTPPQSRAAADMDKHAGTSQSSQYSNESSRVGYQSVQTSPNVDAYPDGFTFRPFAPSETGDERSAQASVPAVIAPPALRPPPRRSTVAKAATGSRAGPQAPALAATLSLPSPSARSASADPPHGGPRRGSEAAMTAKAGSSGSDASHYDDQDEEVRALPAPFLNARDRTSTSASMPVVPQIPDAFRSELGHRSPDPPSSPSVPRRRSSARFPTDYAKRSSHDSSMSASVRTSTLGTKGVKSSSSSSQHDRRNSARSLTSDHGAGPAGDRDGTGLRGSRQGSASNLKTQAEHEEFDARQQAEIEQQWAASADPNRPRTLKEARALAKERARQRHEATQDGTEGDVTATSGYDSAVKTTPQARPANASQNGERSISPVGADMTDLQAAIGDALQDVSFSSSTTNTSSTQRSGGTTLQPQPPRRGDSINEAQARPGVMLAPPPRKNSLRDIDDESTTGMSVTSSSAFDTARESPGPHSPWSAALSVESSAIEAGVRVDPHQAHSAAHDSESMSFSPPVDMAPTVVRGPAFNEAQHGMHGEPPITPTAPRAPASQYVSHAPHPSQATIAPGKIPQINIYGKTVPWPPAFDPAAIIEQKRLAPWERARSYAHYCNDLCTTPTGLQVWLEVMQRPAQRQQRQAHFPMRQPMQTPTHQRREGSGGYAPSMRSEMTFPMRGDGGRAKELGGASISQATMSPAERLPPNLPYPALAQRPPQHPHHAMMSSSSQGNLLSRQASRPKDAAGSVSHGHTASADRMPTRNFFQSLGRRGSTKRQGGSGNAIQPSPSMISSPRMAGPGGSLAPLTRATDSGGSLSPSFSQPALYHKAGANDSALDVSPRLGGSRPLASETSHASSGIPASMSMSSARLLPAGPRAPHGLSPTSPSARHTQTSPSSDEQSSGPSSLTRGASSISTLASSQADGGRQNADGSMRHISPKAVNVPLPGNVPPGPKSANAYTGPRSVRRPSHGSVENAESGVGGLLGRAGLRRGSNSMRRPSDPSTQRPAIPPRTETAPAAVPLSAEENRALDKLADVLPDADRSTLLTYLRRAHGNDLVAIGDYLQDRSKGR